MVMAMVVVVVVVVVVGGGIMTAAPRLLSLATMPARPVVAAVVRPRRP
jgi:hypothetical protein